MRGKRNKMNDETNNKKENNNLRWKKIEINSVSLKSPIELVNSVANVLINQLIVKSKT